MKNYPQFNFKGKLTKTKISILSNKNTAFAHQRNQNKFIKVKISHEKSFVKIGKVLECVKNNCQNTAKKTFFITKGKSINANE